MKKLVLIAALVAAPAFADTWELPNQSGGKIVLQESVCIMNGGRRYENLRNMFAMSSSGKTFSGCWYMTDGWVHVIYNDQTEYTYPANAFTYIRGAKPKGTSL